MQRNFSFHARETGIGHRTPPLVACALFNKGNFLESGPRKNRAKKRFYDGRQTAAGPLRTGRMDEKAAKCAPMETPIAVSDPNSQPGKKREAKKTLVATARAKLTSSATKGGTTPMDDLPAEILWAILTEHVAKEDKVACQWVSHRWRAIVRHGRTRRRSDPEGYMLALAQHGRCNTMKWARANGCPWDGSLWYGGITNRAAEHGHLAILLWASAEDWVPTPWTCACAAKGGHLDVIQWARDNGASCDEGVCIHAAQGGHLDVIKWARANGCPWDKCVCAYAARGGHLGVLEWAHENGCLWSASACAFAAEGGHLEVLQWLRANGCPWDKRTVALAFQGGHTEVLEWARDKGCPGADAYALV